MSDEVIWQVINHQFCAFKIKTDKGQNFCRNEYNVSGLCNRQSCPLANARYATVKNIEGRLYLYMKTAERAHLPSKMWERIKLLKNYNTALEQIDERLKYWQKFLIHKCKQRLTRLTQVAITERRMAMREDERHYVGIKHKVKRREEKRERKALSAAKIEKAIEKELLDRLKSGAYGDKPLNVDDKVWKKILSKMDNKQRDIDEDEDEDDVELISDEELEDESDIGEVEYVEDDGEDELVDVEDLEKWLDDSSESESEEEEEDEETNDEANDNDKRRKVTDNKRRKKPRIEVEYEQEEEPNDIQTNIVY